LAQQFAFQLLPAATSVAESIWHQNMPNVRIGRVTSTTGYTMTDDHSRDHLPPAAAAPSPERKPLSPAARRALAEAEARRLAAAEEKSRPKELQGPKGPEPTRYGDWENKGIASDF
jgi:hypothetical protein